MEEIKENLINKPEQEKSEIQRERELKELEKETISYERFKEISKEILEKYKEPKNNEIRFAEKECKILEISEEIIISFSTREMQNLCRKIFENFPYQGIEINKKNDDIIKEKVKKWKKIIYEKFAKKLAKDFGSSEEAKEIISFIGHMWLKHLGVLLLEN